MLSRNIKIVGSLCDIEKGVGIKAFYKNFPLITKIALDLKIGIEIEREIGSILKPPSEFLPHGIIGKIGDVADHPGYCQTEIRLFPIIIVSSVPVRICHDGLPVE